MARTDVDIIDAVVTEWSCGVGGSIVIRAILWLITALRNGYGKRTTVKGVTDALKNLSRDANKVRLNLKAEYLKEHPEENLPFMEESILLLHMFRNLRATLDHLQSRKWWQERIPLPMQRSFAAMWERTSNAPVVNSIDDLASVCYNLTEDLQNLGNALSLAPNQYTELCVKWMCFQVANAIPLRALKLVGDEPAKAETRLMALEQANEWMKKVADDTSKCE